MTVGNGLGQDLVYNLRSFMLTAPSFLPAGKGAGGGTIYREEK